MSPPPRYPCRPMRKAHGARISPPTNQPPSLLSSHPLVSHAELSGGRGLLSLAPRQAKRTIHSVLRLTLTDVLFSFSIVSPVCAVRSTPGESFSGVSSQEDLITNDKIDTSQDTASIRSANTHTLSLSLSPCVARGCPHATDRTALCRGGDR